MVLSAMYVLQIMPSIQCNKLNMLCTVALLRQYRNSVSRHPLGIRVLTDRPTACVTLCCLRRQLPATTLHIYSRTKCNCHTYQTQYNNNNNNNGIFPPGLSIELNNNKMSIEMIVFYSVNLTQNSEAQVQQFNTVF